MKLYFNKYRRGMNTQILFLKKPVVRPPAPETYRANVDIWGLVDMLTQLQPTLTQQQAVEVVAYYVEIAYFTKKLGVIAARVWIREQVLLFSTWMTVGLIVNVAIVAGFVVLVLYLWNPKVIEAVWQYTWGGDWTMRYEERIWNAEFVKFGPNGEAIFRRLAPYDAPIMSERRRTAAWNVRGDVWYFAHQWIEQEKIGLLWQNYNWTTSVMGWVGLCDRVGSALYQLQDAYYGNLPPQ